MLSLTRRVSPLFLLFLLIAALAGPLLADGDEVEMEDCSPLWLSEPDDEFFISVRLYPGVDPADYDAIIDFAQNGFLPIVSEAPGFVLYAIAVVQPDELLAVNVFNTEAEMLASNAQAADFVSENLAPLLPEAPQITSGSVPVLALPVHCDAAAMDADSEEMASDDEGQELDAAEAMDDMQALFLSFRRYEGIDTADRDEITRVVRDVFVPVIMDSPGFRLYLTLDTGEDVAGALNIFATEAEMIASNEKAATFVTGELAQYLPQAPEVSQGDVGVFELAEMNDMDDEAG